MRNGTSLIIHVLTNYSSLTIAGLLNIHCKYHHGLYIFSIEIVISLLFGMSRAKLIE